MFIAGVNLTCLKQLYSDCRASFHIFRGFAIRFQNYSLCSHHWGQGIKWLGWSHVEERLIKCAAYKQEESSD